MLVIRMQRTGRSGHAQFRVVVQDSRRTPTSGKIVASLGHFDPHSKQTTLDKEKAKFYLEHGAQPSDRVARLLKAEGVKLPKWVTLSENKKRAVRNPEKRRSTRPADAEAKADKPAEPEASVEEPAASETPAVDVKASDAAESAEAPAADAAASEANETSVTDTAEEEPQTEAAPETSDTPVEAAESESATAKTDEKPHE